MNTILVEAIMNNIRKRGIDESTIQAALEICWIHATGEAFYMPDYAFEKMGRPERKVYAEHIIDVMVVREIEEKAGELSPEDIEQVNASYMEIDKFRPLMRLDKGETLPWIVGKRSDN